MTDYKFKKGDRVRYTGEGQTAYTGRLLSGSVGTVAQDESPDPYISWDGFTGGHDFADNSGATNQWSVDEDDLELLVEPSVEAFKIGQRVRECRMDREGVVVEGNYSQYIGVMLDGWEHISYWLPSQLTSIEQAPTSPAKPEFYVTAWLYGGSFSLTGDAPFPTKEAAAVHAYCLASENADHTVAVFKMVSKHSSALTVTSEDV